VVDKITYGLKTCNAALVMGSSVYIQLDLYRAVTM